MKAKKNGYARLYGAGVEALLPVLLAGSLLSLTACSDKTEPQQPQSAQLSQQESLKQKIDELLKKAEAGDADAQESLAERYAAGDGVPKDAVKAIDLFEKSAAKGIAKAQYHLSRMYGNGEGVPADSARALDLLMQSAANGYADAEEVLAERYAAGDGVPKDTVKAVDLFEKSAAKGIAKAQYHLSRMYGKGEGVPADSAKALDLLRQSAANGYAKAQSMLAGMYAKGEGVERDDVLAYAWSILALRQGDEDADDAKRVHDTVALSDLLRNEAEQLAAEWQRGVALVHKAVAAKPGDEAAKSEPGHQ